PSADFTIPELASDGSIEAKDKEKCRLIFRDRRNGTPQ
ncbi:MAG: hypothetical protein QG610_2243, partial [Euryarchaeota archaeon]|nr:hypothetical protein [Euryarchaeota archaeon]